MIFNTHRGLRDINPIYVVSIRPAKFIPFMPVNMNSSHLNYRVDVSGDWHLKYPQRVIHY